MALIQRQVRKPDLATTTTTSCWSGAAGAAIQSGERYRHHFEVIRMTYSRAISLSVLTIVLFPSLVSAQVNGVWDFTNSGCSGDFRLTIGMWDDGEPIGKITSPGFRSPIYNIVVEGDHLSFSVDQQDQYTYDYDAKVSGNNMNGACRREELPSRTGTFAARRHTGD